MQRLAAVGLGRGVSFVEDIWPFCAPLAVILDPSIVDRLTALMLFYKLLMISKIALAATLPSTASWPANRAVDAHEIHRVEKRATPSGDEILNALGRHIADARSAAPGSYGASHIKGLETLKAEEYYQWWDCMDEMVGKLDSIWVGWAC